MADKPKRADWVRCTSQDWPCTWAGPSCIKCPHCGSDTEAYIRPIEPEQTNDDELTRLRAQMLEWENREASVCPEDVGFVEYITTLERQKARLLALLNQARDHMTGDGFAFDVKQEIDAVMKEEGIPE